MKINGKILLPTTQQEVWNALNDPTILQRCIPGCTQINMNDDHKFLAKITAKVGPVKSSFATQLTIEEWNPPESYTLIGEGRGKSAGGAKGEVKVQLSTNDGKTTLQYESVISINGKLAQVGSRLIDLTARKWIDKFFATFETVILEQM